MSIARLTTVIHWKELSATLEFQVGTFKCVYTNKFIKQKLVQVVANKVISTLSELPPNIVSVGTIIFVGCVICLKAKEYQKKEAEQEQALTQRDLVNLF